MVNERLLKLRSVIKAKKPAFIKQDSTKRGKLTINWRKPKGIQSKIRRCFRGKRKMPSLGYSSPRAVRGLNRQGMQEVVVRHLSDLEGFDPKTQVVVIGSIGLRKKVLIIEACQAKEYHVVNIPDVPKFLQEVAEHFTAKKQEKKRKEEKKRIEREQALKKADKKKQEEEKSETPVADEETKKGKKSDKIKILEKRE